jgi:hypothetical protein
MLDLEVLALFVLWCFMLFTEINQGFFATPETAPYASLKDIHKDIKEEVELLETALNALNATGNPLFNTPLELLEHGKKLRQRYDDIRGNEDMSFRDNLFYLHAYRISLTFARLNIAQTLSLFTFPQMQAILDAPIPVQTFYFFSVAFLATRLLLNVLNAAKHAAFPSIEEEMGLASSYDRFIHELSLIDMQILNDIVWATANLFTNYPGILGLSNPAVNATLLLCLTFDLVLSAYMYDQNEIAYAAKTSEYKHALAQMTPGDINFEVLSMQRKQLELNYLGDKAKLEQFLAAGTVILLAFSFIASSALPFFLPLGAALCVFGTSLYLTAGKRGEYIKAPSTEKDTAYAVYTDALIKNTIYPLLFMVTAASVGWPIAMLLAASVVIYDNKETIENMLEPAEATHFHLA